MAGSNTISITYRIDGDNRSFKELSKDAEALKQVLTNTLEEARTASQSISFAAMTQSIEAAQSALSSLRDAMNDLAQAYATQQQAESQLEVMMRNRMGASEEMIQSIKDLAAAQQQLGVIGDEVQLAGAKQMTMYLEQKESLERLIPAMNDLLALQSGFNASAGDAESIAKAMGKAMDGNTTALTRMGVKFSDAQLTMLKYGDETQRAEALTNAITASVGGMNEELARTDAGKQKQLENALGDIKEKLGQMTSAALPFVTLAANATIALAGVMKLAAGVKAMVLAMTRWGVVSRSVAAVNGLLSTAVNGLLAKLGLYSTAAGTATVATRVLGVAIKGLLITTGVGAAIWALSEAISYLTGSSDDATKSLDNMTDAEKRAAEAADQQRQAEEEVNRVRQETAASLELNIARLKNFNGTKEEEKKIVEELNNTYGQTLGYFSSVDSWYRALIADSAKYTELLILEAEARQLANQIANDQAERAELERKREKAIGTNSSLKVPQLNLPLNTSDNNELGGNRDPYGRLLDFSQELYGNRIAIIDGRIAENTKKLDANLKRQQEIAKTMPVKGAAAPPSGGGGGHTGAGKTGNTKKTNTAKTPQKGDHLIGDPQTIEDWENNKAYYEKALGKEKDAETRQIYTDLIADIDGRIKYMKDARGYIEALAKEAAGNVASLLAAAEENTVHEDANTLEGAQHNIRVLEKKQQTATPEELPAINAALQKWREYEAELQGLGVTAQAVEGSIAYLDKQTEKLNEELTYCVDTARIADINKELQALAKQRQTLLDSGVRVFDPDASTLEGIEKNIDILNEKLQSATVEEAAALNKTIALWQKKADAIRNAGTQQGKWFSDVKEGWGLVKSFGSSLTSISEALKSNASAWDKLIKVMDGLFGVADAIFGVVRIIKTLSEAGDAAAASSLAVTTAQTVQATTAAATAGTVVTAEEAKAAASKDAASAAMGEAAATVIAQNAALGLAGVAKSAVTIALMQALFQAAKLPTFAKGGIAYGPTLGLFGEYAGARHNPEVVAPLDKLRTMIQPSGFPAGKVKFVIEGRTLVGVLRKENNLYRRT